jgi:DNA-binding NarL/FixJ family response regulator
MADACPLSSREIAVIKQLSFGKSAKMIADELHMTKTMVDRSVASAMRSLHMNAATGLVGEALRKGWIQ